MQHFALSKLVINFADIFPASLMDQVVTGFTGPPVVGSKLWGSEKAWGVTADGCSSRGWIERGFMVSAEGPGVPHLLGWAAEDDMNVVHYCVSLHLLYYQCRISRRFLLGVMVDTKASKFAWAVTYEKCYFCWRTRVPLSVWLILYH